MPDPTKEQFDAAAERVAKNAPPGLSEDQFFALVDKELAGGSKAAAPAKPAPKWYEPGGDQLLDNIRGLANPEVAAGIAGLLSGGSSAAATIGIPAAVGGLTSLARDMMSGESGSTMALDAAGHTAANAIPGALGKGIGLARAAPEAAMSAAEMIPGIGKFLKLRKLADLADMLSGKATAEVAAPKVAKAAATVVEKAAPVARSPLDYLTGTAMVDASQADRMILAKQRSALREIAQSKAAMAAAEKAAAATKAAAEAAEEKAKALAAGKAKEAAAALAKELRIKTVEAYVAGGTRALIGAGSLAAQESK